MAPPLPRVTRSEVTTGPLVVDRSYVPDGLLLFELSPEIESDLRAGKRVCIKGQESAVLCTESHTFGIKRVETSNSCLLVPLANDDESASKPAEQQLEGSENNDSETNSVGQTCVRSSSTCHYELVPQTPIVDLNSYIETSSKRVASMSDGTTEQTKLPGMTLAELETRVPASLAEIKSALGRCHAMELENGRWCVLGAPERIPLFNAVLTACIANSWHIGSLEATAVVKEVPELQCRNVRRLVLGPYGNAVAAAAQQNQEIWQLDSEKVARFRARQILEQMHNKDLTGKGVLEDQFRTSWQLSLPDGAEGSSLDLRGLAVKELAPGLATMSLLRFFPVDEMPSDAKRSFSKIFRFRAQWPLEELQIYMNHLVGPSVTLAALLKRYTRACKDANGRHVHSAR